MVTKKKKERKNADFKKIKLKVGKKLVKTTTTDTTITAKRVVLVSQLGEKSESSSQPLSYRGLSLDELCKQLGHFNKNIRKDAIMGTKQLLSSRPDLIQTHLRTLIPSIARLISDASNDATVFNQLKSLLLVICTAPAHSMAAHFTLFLAHVLRALTHMETSIRSFALSVLVILMSNYRELCKNNVDLFNSFVKFLGSSRKPIWNAPKFLETVLAFLTIYDVAADDKSSLCQEVGLKIDSEEVSDSIDMRKAFGSACPFDFPVTSSSATATASPFEEPQALLSLTRVVAPVITTSLLEDRGGLLLAPTVAILELLSRAIVNQQNAFLITDFHAQLKKILEPVKKAAASRKSDKVRNAAYWLQRY